jgi:hypothetical protein
MTFKPHQATITFGTLDIGGGMDTVTCGFPAITSTIRTIMRDGFRATGLTVVVGGSGLRVTGDISRTQGQLLELVSGRERLAWVTVVDPGSSVAARDKTYQVEYLG